MKLTQLIKPTTLAIATLVVGLDPTIAVKSLDSFSDSVNPHFQLTTSSCSLPDETPPKTTQTDENA